MTRDYAMYPVDNYLLITYHLQDIIEDIGLGTHRNPEETQVVVAQTPKC